MDFGKLAGPHGQQGIILITVLLILFLLVAVGLGSIVSVHNDYRVTSNIRSATAALYLAESGIEWTKEQIAAATNLPLELADRTLALRTGDFNVSVLTSIQPSPLRGQLVVRSTGNASNAAQTVQARITKRYDLADAALVFRGAARGFRLLDASFLSDGRDHDLTTLAVLTDSPARFGATAGSVELFDLINGALDETRANTFASKNIGRRAIAQTDWLPRELVSELADGICSAGAARITAIPASGTLAIKDQSWGTRNSPEIRCIEGTSDATDSINIMGNTSGAGILVLRNLEMIVSGSFGWDGLIVITGRDVGLRITGLDRKEITGAIVINETGAALGSGPTLFDVQGNLRILFSRQSLDLSATLIPPAVLKRGFPKLPFTLHQDYWRTISP